MAGRDAAVTGAEFTCLCCGEPHRSCSLNLPVVCRHPQGRHLTDAPGAMHALPDSSFDFQGNSVSVDYVSRRSGSISPDGSRTT